jgi:hypothetical protein
MMPSVAGISFDSRGMSLADAMPAARRSIGKSIPFLAIKNAVFQMLHFGVKPLEGCSATPTEHQGHSSSCATIKRFDDPAFVFL